MKKDSDKPTENQKGGFPVATISLWAAAVIIFYVLGVGPVVMLDEKGVISGRTEDAVMAVYGPVDWAYEETPLHKPIGMYLHLWSTNFDSSGELR